MVIVLVIESDEILGGDRQKMVSPRRAADKAWAILAQGEVTSQIGLVLDPLAATYNVPV
jgi:hypothetical protein